MKNWHTTLLILLILVSCGKKNSNNSSKPDGSNHEPQTASGNYRAILQAINPELDQNKSFGTATIHVVDDSITIKLNLINAPSGIKHIQSIHQVGRCPNQSRDKNNDKVVDVLEGMVDFGKILVPLDGDLATQDAGLDYAPSTNGSGAYSYHEDEVLSSLVADLYTVDANPSDYIMKLKSDQKLDLAHASFVVLGVSNSTDVPATAATIHGLPAEATIPIACGAIVKIATE
ncbi:MAG: hypothetical protein H0V66_12440 [Bdellovibrionales bacterium]|nr:hypothetical protein [Bdellovibrionales bacterium]